MNRIKYISFSVLLSTLLFSCGAKKTATSSEVGQLDDQSAEKFQQLYFEAQKEKAIENYESSYEKFSSCAALDNSEDAIFYELAKLDTLQADFASALSNIQKAIDLDKNNLWYARLEADVLVEMGDLEGALEALHRIADRDPKDVQYRDKLANLAVYLKEYSAALEAYSQIESITGVNEDITRQKYGILLEQGKFEDGLKELEKLSASSPTNLSYLRNIALHQNSYGNSAEALSTLEKIVELDPTDGDTQLALAEIYSANGNKDKSNQALQAGFSDAGASVEQKLAILSSVLSSGDQSVNLNELSTSMRNAHPDRYEVWIMAGEIAGIEGDLEQSSSFFSKALELEPNNLNLWLETCELLAAAGNYSELEKTGGDALLRYPLQPDFYLYKGEGELNQKKYEAARSSFNSGKDFVVDNNELKATFFEKLGIVSFYLNDNSGSDSYFQKALELATDDSPLEAIISSSYAYTLAYRSSNLEMARSLNEKAQGLVKDHPGIEFTEAFIEFKAENFTVAQKWIDSALTHGGDSRGKILELAGDIYAKLGNTSQAVSYWTAAKERGNTSSVIERKIADEQYISE